MYMQYLLQLIVILLLFNKQFNFDLIDFYKLFHHESF